jgi:hypothetical protein
MDDDGGFFGPANTTNATTIAMYYQQSYWQSLWIRFTASLTTFLANLVVAVFLLLLGLAVISWIVVPILRRVVRKKNKYETTLNEL